MNTIAGQLEPVHYSQVAGDSGYDLTGPEVTTVHNLCNVLRHLVHNSSAYHTEGAQDEALRHIAQFEKHASGRNYTTEWDRAAKEDVSLRRAPQTGLNVPAAPPPAQLDYDRLAAAILAAQRQASQDNNTTPAEEVPQ